MRWSGNTGKMRIQKDLLGTRSPIRVIDVGAVGTGPLDLWKDIPIASLPIEVVAVDRDEGAVLEAKKLGLPIDLRVVDGYELSQHLPPGTFDLALCTQVLEHVARPTDFLTQIRQVLREDGRILLTVDSGHFSQGHAGDPLWKRLARPIAARFSEEYHDFGLTRDSLESALESAGFEVAELMHCNLGPLKPLFGTLSEDDADLFAPHWLSFEESLASAGFGAASLFRCIYAEARAV